MRDFVIRMIRERDDLKGKAKKLNLFITSNVEFKKLDKEQKDLMVQQLECQNRYIDILDKRIKLNGGDTNE